MGDRKEIVGDALDLLISIAPKGCYKHFRKLESELIRSRNTKFLNKLYDQFYINSHNTKYCAWYKKGVIKQTDCMNYKNKSCKLTEYLLNNINNKERLENGIRSRGYN